MKYLIAIFYLLHLSLFQFQHPFQSQSQSGSLQAQNVVRGTAFIDENLNGLHDRGESFYEGLEVSNGRNIVSTDRKGKYSIPKLEGRFVFAIKPTGYQFLMDKDFQPSFYASPDAEKFDIALRPSPGEDKYSLVLMGDPQVYAQDQINYLGEVATDELRGGDHDFMIVLGDLVGNTLSALPKVKTTLGLAEKTSYYVLGNHDRDRGDFKDPSTGDNDSFENSYGPDYYSFNWGNVHFLVINDVKTVDPKEFGRDYYPGIHPFEAEFIKNDLARVAPEKLVVLCAHIPFFLEDKKIGQTQEILSMLENHPKVFLATGHAHNQIQLFFDEDEGRKPGQSIHQLVAGAICGGWWRGEPDIYGIPGSMMRDGTPQGYWFMHVEGTDYQLEYKASGRDRDKQMHIWVPYYNEQDTIMNSQVDERDIWVNVYAGNEFTEVELRIDRGKWQSIERKVASDPYALRIQYRQKIGRAPSPGAVPIKEGTRECTHLWYSQVPEGIAEGAHVLEVRAKNDYGLDASANRVFWVKQSK